MGFNWAGATAGLLGAVSEEADKYGARKAEQQKMQMERELADRKERAAFAKEMAMEKYKLMIEDRRDQRQQSQFEQQDKRQAAQFDQQNSLLDARLNAKGKGGDDGEGKPMSAKERAELVKELREMRQSMTPEDVPYYNELARAAGMPEIEAVEKAPASKGILGFGGNDAEIEFVEKSPISKTDRKPSTTSTEVTGGDTVKGDAGPNKWKAMLKTPDEKKTEDGSPKKAKVDGTSINLNDDEEKEPVDLNLRKAAGKWLDRQKEVPKEERERKTVDRKTRERNAFLVKNMPPAVKQQYLSLGSEEEKLAFLERLAKGK